MNRIHIVKDGLCAALGALGAFISAFYGGWSAALTTLVIFMIIDYLTGMIVAGVFHKSEKTPDGTLESRVGWKGLCRKGVSLLVVLIACRLDLMIGTNFIRDTVVIAFVVNETLSIIENAGLMGVPIPRVIVSAIHVLKEKADANADKIEPKPPDTQAKAEEKDAKKSEDWTEDLDDPEG